MLVLATLLASAGCISALRAPVLSPTRPPRCGWCGWPRKTARIQLRGELPSLCDHLFIDPLRLSPNRGLFGTHKGCFEGHYGRRSLADPHSCRPHRHTAHNHKDPRRERHTLNQHMAEAVGAGGLRRAPSTRKKSGQQAPSVRQRAAGWAYSLRCLEEDEDGGLVEPSGELRRN